MNNMEKRLIEFEFDESTTPPFFAKVRFNETKVLYACGDTYEQAEERMREKLERLGNAPPPPEPIEI